MPAPLPSYASRQSVRLSIALVPSAAGGACHKTAAPSAIRLAAARSQLDGAWWAVPRAVDGLLVVRDIATPAPASASLTDLAAAGVQRAWQRLTRRAPP